MDTNYCSSFSYTKENMCECISCCTMMLGVYSYEARDTCVECGGKSNT